MPEKRYIDANKIIEKLNRAEINPTTVFICETLKGLINDAPTEYVIPVVRCKDCKYWHNSEGVGWCDINSHFENGDWNRFIENDFCSYGKGMMRNDL